MTDNTVKLGIDNLIENHLYLIKNKNIALLANIASVNNKNKPTSLLLYEIIGSRLKKILAPEHGFYGFKEYMVKIESEFDLNLKIPIYSLYGDDIEPSDNMLADIDTLIFDLQDIGVRYYTYASTLALCMKKCSILHKELIILDRPNPLSGNVVQGTILEKGFESFVGQLNIPIRHGLTIGELALLIKDYFKYELSLTVVKMQNWRRDMFWDDTNLYWIQPSPNMPTWKTTIFYPGTCLLEGTNISEGRGTTKPFEIIGSPWINPFELASFLNNLNLPHISALPVFFIPKFDKYQNEKCGGIQLCISNPKANSYNALIKIIEFLYHNHKKNFKWRPPPYEFNYNIMPFDLLNGTDKIRLLIENNDNLDNFIEETQNKLLNYCDFKKQYHLY
jgi:uncharacterized protein YbbC (DUF1343 family)